MPKVRILSGNQTGSVVELETPAAQASVDTGYAEYVHEPAPAKAHHEAAHHEPEKAKKKKGDE